MAITLNAFVAFFTTLAAVTLLIPVTEAVSQWKWNYFMTEQPLSDFEVFDDASRGAWGSVLLLRRFSFRFATPSSSFREGENLMVA